MRGAECAHCKRGGVQNLEGDLLIGLEMIQELFHTEAHNIIDQAHTENEIFFILYTLCVSPTPHNFPLALISTQTRTAHRHTRLLREVLIVCSKTLLRTVWRGWR